MKGVKKSLQEELYEKISKRSEPTKEQILEKMVEVLLAAVSNTHQCNVCVQWDIEDCEADLNNDFSCVEYIRAAVEKKAKEALSDHNQNNN